MKILIDNGHSKVTPGKCSPDHSFFEWKFNREIAIAVTEELCKRGYDTERIVTEDSYDVTLTERCSRVNRWCKKLGAKNVIFISIHANAGDHGSWTNARGFSVFIAKQCSDASKKLAQSLYAAADKRELRGNRSVPKCHYWQANFTVITKTLCPAVLTENLFYDNREDLKILQSEEGKRKIVDLHVEGIINYLDSLKHESTK